MKAGAERRPDRRDDRRDDRRGGDDLEERAAETAGVVATGEAVAETGGINCANVKMAQLLNGSVRIFKK